MGTRASRWRLYIGMGINAAVGTALKTKPLHLQGLDVAIIGGGIAGLASAVSLRTIAGISATVYDMNPGFGRGGYGLALWPNGLRALRHMDVSLHDEVVRSGSAIEERLLTTCESTAIEYCDERQAFGHPMLCLRFLSLYNALRRAALRHGCEIVPGTTCNSMKAVVGENRRTGRAEIVVTREGGEEGIVTADLVVGADGLRSLVRRHLGDLTQPRNADCVWVYGIVSHATCPVLLRSRTHTFFLNDPSKAASLMPVGEYTYWAAALTGKDGQRVMAFPEDHRGSKEVKRFLTDKFAECQALIEHVDATAPNEIQRRQIQDRPASDTFVSTCRPGEIRSLLVGDAAHPTRPSLGQGANMALEDAVQLALLLRDTCSVEQALGEYDAARVVRCATLQGDFEFLAKRRGRSGGEDWRAWGGEVTRGRQRPANMGMGDANFVYNWQPERLHRHPWATQVKKA